MAVTMSAYTFQGGYPTPETVDRAYDDADLNRAVSAYRFFFPTVSCMAMFKGTMDVGVKINRVFSVLDTQPKHVGFTLNSDTPYAPILLDLRAGPVVLEFPPGPLLAAALDVNQRWITDMGLPGPDAGGKHLLLPPDFSAEVPDGYYAAKATTFRTIVGCRSIPVGGDVQAAIDRLRSIRVYPLQPSDSWSDPTWIDMTSQPQDTTPLRWEHTLDYWAQLHAAVETEPHVDEFRAHYGELAAIGIAKGKPFAPDARMRHILEEAAEIANAQMRVQAFADRRPDRVAWTDRQWQWAALRFEDGWFNTADYLDVYAREKWFYQAIASSRAMFRRAVGFGSVYWLGARDQGGAYLDGGKSYRLRVPQPVPGRLFWSVTVYDAETRSQIQTDQGKAALRSLFELRDLGSTDTAELRFGPSAPSGLEGQWIKTIPGKGWFVYFRVYGPEQPVFDGSWRPGDFEAE